MWCSRLIIVSCNPRRIMAITRPVSKGLRLIALHPSDLKMQVAHDYATAPVGAASCKCLDCLLDLHVPSKSLQGARSSSCHYWYKSKNILKGHILGALVAANQHYGSIATFPRASKEPSHGKVSATCSAQCRVDWCVQSQHTLSIFLRMRLELYGSSHLGLIAVNQS